MMIRASLVGLLLASSACKRDCPAPPAAEPAARPAPPPSSPPPLPATATLDCGAMSGQNPVQTEMRQLECALERAVVALGRDDLPAIAHAIHVVHGSKEKTAAAIQSGAWKPAQGDVTAFVALDEAFHKELEALVIASQAKDHAATSAALGRTLGACQGCHATFRPLAPPPTPWAATAPAAPAPHGH